MTEPAFGRGNVTESVPSPSMIGGFSSGLQSYHPEDGGAMSGPHPVLSPADVRNRAIERMFQFSQPNATLTPDQIRGLALFTELPPETIRQCFQMDGHSDRPRKPLDVSTPPRSIECV
jgi:hypothetical protein